MHATALMIPTEFKPGLQFSLFDGLVLAAAGLIFGLVLSLALPTIYTASASVLIQPLDGNAYAPNQQGSDLTRLETEAQVVTSDAVHEGVVAAFARDGRRPPQRSGLSVSVTTNAQVIQVAYAARSRAVAAAAAQQYADSYLELRKLRRDTFIDNRRDALSERIDDLGREIDKLRRQDAESPQIPAVQAQQTNLRLQLAALEAADTDPGSIIRMPQAQRGGLYLSPPLGALAGLLGGLFLGAIIALVLERRSEVLRTVDDVEHLGVAVLGAHAGERAPDDATTATPHDVAFLAGTILNRRAVVPATVAISSLASGVAVAGFAEELAKVLSHGREGVLLVDAASDEPTKAPGFSEVLFGSVALKDALTTKKSKKNADLVDRLAIGREPEQGLTLYSTSRMSEALAGACDSYDWVIITGPEAAKTSGRAVVGACDHWIPVVVLGRSTREDLERGLAWARTTGVEPLGVVVIDGSMARPGLRRRTAASATAEPVEATTAAD